MIFYGRETGMDEKMQKESMQARMSRLLLGKGYSEVNLHSENEALFYLANGTAVSLVWLIGDAALSAMSRETYLNHYEKIRSDFSKHHFDPIHSITLFFTSDTDKAKEIGEDTPFWITDESYGRLIVYENQPEDYDGLRRVLEQNLHFGLFEDIVAASKTNLNPTVAVEEMLEQKRKTPKFYLACGRKDDLMKSSEDFRDFLKGKGLDVTWDEDPNAAHEWDFWDAQIKKVLDWLPLGGENAGLSSGNVKVEE